VLRDRPDAANIHEMLARAYVANGQPALAEQSLHTAMDLAPKDTSLRLELASLLVRTERAEQAVTLLEQTAHDAPDAVPVRVGLIQAYLAKKDLVHARAAAESLETLQPHSAAGFYLAGVVAQADSRPADAQKAFEQALALQPSALDALSALARLELSRGEAAQATSLVKNASEHDPKNPTLLNLLGEIYLTQHNAPLAITAFNSAIALAPTWPVPQRGVALAKVAANDMPGAIAAYEGAIKAAPNDPQLVSELGLLYERNGRPEDAIKRYEAWRRANPADARIANNLAMLLVTYRNDRASLDEAHTLTANFASSGDGSLLDTCGWVHFKRAEYADALPVLLRAAERIPNSKEIHYHLGMTELLSGQTSRAQADLELAVAGPANFRWSADARNALAGLKHQAS
jgi:Flp pilus assembly protein TadD